MTKYDLYENKGRQKFATRFGRFYYIVFATDPTSRWDFMATGRTKSNPTYVGEIKNVGRPYGKYNEDSDMGYLIDFDKLKALKKIALNEGRKAILVVFFTDRTVIWEISDGHDAESFGGWQARGIWKSTNKKGVDYGKEKDWEYITYLFLGEAVYNNEEDDDTATWKNIP